MFLHFRQPSYTVKRKGKEIDIEEIFLDKLARQKEQENNMENIRLEKPLNTKSFFALISGFSFIFFVFAFLSFRLQIWEHQKYALWAQKNNSLITRFSAERGIIYDRNQTALVKNETQFNFYLNRQKLDSSLSEQEAINHINNIFGWQISAPKMNDLNLFSTTSDNATSPDPFLLIKENISQQDLVLWETKKEEIPFGEVKKQIVRRYQSDACLGHILGYIGKISPQEWENIQLASSTPYELTDYIGKQGVEKFYEQILREKKGVMQIERDARGNQLSQRLISQPSSGDHLVLNIDLALQKKIFFALQNTLSEIGKQKGAAIAINPQNGEILAMVSLPCYDNNLFSSNSASQDLEKLVNNKTAPFLNRVVSGLYASGSTIKPFIASAALEEKIISSQTTLFCPLKICVPNIYQKGKADCFPDNKFHGWTDVKRAIAESVNPFFYIIGGGYTAPSPSSAFYQPDLPKYFKGLGVERIKNYLSLFNFGQKTNIDLPSEAQGRIPDPQWKESFFSTPLAQKWYLGDTYNLSIGQGYFLTTPLQLAVAYSAIANGGKIIKPHLAKAILNASNGNVIKEFTPEIIRENFLSANTLQIVRQGMRQAVFSPAGSAFSLSALSVPVAAKTGTAQAYGAKEMYNNWIAVFAPYEKPEIVLVVLIEEVPGLRGSAQKTAKEILSWYFSAQKNSPKKEKEQPLSPLATSTDISFEPETSPDFPRNEQPSSAPGAGWETVPISTTTDNISPIDSLVPASTSSVSSTPASSSPSH